MRPSVAVSSVIVHGDRRRRQLSLDGELRAFHLVSRPDFLA
jgi:hypothetical protein